MKTITIQRMFFAATASIFGAATLGFATPAVGATDGPSCQNITRAVALGPGLPADQTVSGTYCVPGSYNGPKTIDILAHGATYNRSYWNFPVDQPQYSYVFKTLLAGRATLAYDRLGSGTSSRPASAVVTVESDAYILHQLIDWARSSEHFNKVDVVGHSIGSIVAVNETATYNDADRLILTGFLHTITPGQTQAISALYPALLDPQFSGQIADPGYLTTIPGQRGPLFYSAIADPAVVAYDEAHKDVASATQFGGAVAQTQAPAPVNISQNIHIPVLEVVGTLDLLECVGANVNCSSEMAVRNFELPYFGGAPSLSVATIALTGHDLALHPTANLSFLRINNWINTH